ncbi:uroporphyrinogen-III synthase [Halopiger djelfimassiliensis]|uniref:uroporphyrinogen-III synthase n=1 Tax=Halopiger djelfimassiliensis TaxID=1293047 RepID=UPI0006780951|nr:uroporphyrinogen-III synthase [Halopiger djelfimassiliensis]
MSDSPTVAVFRPDDDRIEAAVSLLESLDADPVPDPMLAIDATGATPRTDAEYVVFTSKTGAELVSRVGWEASDETVCAIGPATAEALREEGYAVDLVPEEYTSSGLAAALEGRVAGSRVEVARSDHGSDVLLEGLVDAGAYVHETTLYRLVRPEDSGESTALAAAGELDAACFTSSLTVEHFLDAAEAGGVLEAARTGLADAVVGVIGEPTRETALEHGIDVDLVASEATFERLASETVAEATATDRA